MAKDVDLSSREWTDLVFEGKNKEFGAYQLRSNSAKRHNMAMLAVLVFIAAVVAISLLVKAMERADAADETLKNDQEEAVLANTDEVDEEEVEEEEIIEYEEPEEPEVEEAFEEEIANTIQNTEIIIADDQDVTEEDQVKTEEELQETATSFGNTDFSDGTDDVNVVREHKDEVIVEEKKPEAPKVEEIFTAVEEPPTFPGGQEAMYAWMRNNLRYPEMAAQNNIQGRVTVQFVVEKDGSIGEVKVVRGRDPDLDKEAVRMVKAMPKFIPGKMNGQSVRVWFTLPVNFKLAGS